MLSKCGKSRSSIQAEHIEPWLLTGCFPGLDVADYIKSWQKVPKKKVTLKVLTSSGFTGLV